MPSRRSTSSNVRYVHLGGLADTAPAPHRTRAADSGPGILAARVRRSFRSSGPSQLPPAALRDTGIPSAPSETSCGGSTRQSRSWRSISATSALVCSICPRVAGRYSRFCTSIARCPASAACGRTGPRWRRARSPGEPSRLRLTAVRTGDDDRAAALLRPRRRLPGSRCAAGRAARASRTTPSTIQNRRWLRWTLLAHADREQLNTWGGH